MLSPALDDDLHLLKGRDDLAVEQFVTQPPIEALDVAVLPFTASATNSGPWSASSFWLSFCSLRADAIRLPNDVRSSAA